MTDRSEQDTPPADSSAAELDRLAAAYFERRRAGEAITVDDFAAENDAHADDIRALFPALELLEAAPALDATTAPTPQVTAPSIERLGDYRIVQEIGRGGMGVVFDAVEEKLGRRVAVKVLPPQFQLDASLLKRFAREAKAAAGLQHPNIVPVYGLGEDDGVHFFAMQFVDGLTLDRVIARVGEWRTEAGDESMTSKPLVDWVRSTPNDTAPVDPSSTGSAAPSPSNNGRSASHYGQTEYYRSAARVMLEATEAVAYAHARGVQHRDLKPGNLMIDGAGKVWVTDFGLAKLDDGADLTQTGDVLGTVRYMAPERFQGESDARGDVYALGLILYELLTLRPAFDAPNQPALMQRITNGATKRPRAIDPTIPVDLETIALKAMDPLPASRYDSATAMAADLNAWLEARPITARPPTLGYLVMLAVRRHKALSATAAVAALLLVAATAYYVISLRTALDDARTARQNEATERRKAQAAERDEARAREDAEFRSYVAAISAAQSALDGGDLATARKHLADAPAQWRHWEWQHLSSRCDRSVLTVQLTKPKVSRFPYDPKVQVRFLPDGERVLTASFDRITVWHAERGTRLAETKTPIDLGKFAMALAPDGTWFVVRDLSSAEIWTVSPLERVVRFKIGESASAAIHPDGDRLAFGAVSGRILLWDRRTRERVRTITAHSARVSGLAFSPDGRSLASTGHDRRVMLHDLTAGTSRELPVGRSRAGGSLSFDPRGERLVVGFSGGLIRSFDLATDRELLTIGAGKRLTCGPIWGPTGTHIVAANTDGVGRVYNAETGRLEARLLGHAGTIASASFSPSGERLVTSGIDLAIKTWALDDPGAIRTATDHGRDCEGVAFNVDNTLLATAGERDTTVHLYDPATLEPLGVLLGHRDWVTSIAYTAKRDMLVSGGNRGEVIVWDLTTRRVKRRFRAIKRRIWSLAFHPDGRTLIAAGARSVTALDVDTGTVRWRQRLIAAQVFGVAYDPSGRTIAAGTAPSRVFVLDAATGRVRKSLAGHEDAVRSVAFFGEGRYLASGSLDRTVRTWDVETGAARHVLTGHMHGVRALGVSPDGHRLVSAARDGVVKLWDSIRGVEVYSARQARAWSSSVGFSPDGRRIAVGQTFRVTVFDSVPMDDLIGDIRRARPMRPVAAAWSERLLAKHGDVRTALDALARAKDIPAAARPFIERRLRSHPGTRAGMTDWIWRQITGPTRNKRDDYLAWRRIATFRQRKSDWRDYFLHGMANYRRGRTKLALGMLQQEPDAPLDPEMTQARLAFLAMASAKQGVHDGATEALAALRGAVARHATPTTKRLLAEAERVVGRE